MSSRAALEPSTPAAAAAVGHHAQPGRDFAGANNWVTSDRDPSGIATYRGITSAGCLRSFLAPEACDPRIHRILVRRGFAGRQIASGEPFDPRRLIAASTSVLLGSVVKVENRALGKSTRQRLRSLCGRSGPRPFTARRAKNRHRPARSSASETYPD
jgi:hypothetical protein